MYPILRQLRLHQWLKNGFLFFPLFFSKHLGDVSLLGSCTAAFFSFSFAASAIYCLNDICDVEADRAHPSNSKRPIASGELSRKSGIGILCTCLVLSFLFLLPLDAGRRGGCTLIIGVYLFLNTAYCLRLKRYALVDVSLIATGFVLRVIMGGAAASIQLTEWILIMTFLLALLLAFGKRRSDVLVYEQTGYMPRKSVSYYTLSFLNQVLTLLASVTLVAYIMYTVSPEVTGRFQTRYVYLTSLFVLLGIIRYLQIALVEKKSGNPTEILRKDTFIQGCILGWILTFSILIYV